MIAGVKEEIARLDYTITACQEGTNPHNLDIAFMIRCRDALIAYRDIHLAPDDKAAASE